MKKLLIITNGGPLPRVSKYSSTPSLVAKRSVPYRRSYPLIVDSCTTHILALQRQRPNRQLQPWTHHVNANYRDGKLRERASHQSHAGRHFGHHGDIRILVACSTSPGVLVRSTPDPHDASAAASRGRWTGTTFRPTTDVWVPDSSRLHRRIFRSPVRLLCPSECSDNDGCVEL